MLFRFEALFRKLAIHRIDAFMQFAKFTKIFSFQHFVLYGMSDCISLIVNICYNTRSLERERTCGVVELLQYKIKRTI